MSVNPTSNELNNSKKEADNDDDKEIDQDEEEENEISNESDSISSEDREIDDEDTQNSMEQVPSKFLDMLIIRLMSARACAPNVKLRRKRITKFPDAKVTTVQVELQYDELEQLCEMACKSFKQQKSLIQLGKGDLPIVICGDIHGQFQDLREIFFKCGSPHRQSYLFLGDYVDRGAQGIPTLALLLSLKVKYPSKIFLLRGNHESSQTNLSYGFYDECLLQFINTEKNLGETIWKKFVEVFNCMPFASLIDSTIFCVHGGLSPELKSLKDIEQIERPCIIPPHGLACDLVWSDPKVCASRDGWSMSIRGISLAFTPRIVEECCNRFKIDLIVRGHQMLNSGQMMRNGYSFFSGGRLITLFSARNYTNLGNSGAVMRVSVNLKCRFIVFRMRSQQRERKKATTTRKTPKVSES